MATRLSHYKFDKNFNIESSSKIDPSFQVIKVPMMQVKAKD